MQKVIQRSIFAKKQAARRLVRRRDKYNREAWKSQAQGNQHIDREHARVAKEARTIQREDWELGKLAPKRDVGKAKDQYATINPQYLSGKALRKDEINEICKMWGGKYLNLRRGDRVVVLEGRDKGKIGKVEEINLKKGEVTVEGLNLVDVAVAKWMIIGEQDQRPVRTLPQPISLKSIKLVFAMKDQQTGQLRDVIVRKVEHHKFYKDRHSQVTRWQRIIPGINIVVPWPKVDPPRPKEDYPCDTLRREVEEQTFVPTLLTPPMPSSVIDELRNKYSAFRTRHDPEYIAMKQVEDAEAEARKKLAKEMDTPLKQIKRMERKMKKAKGKPKLTRTMLFRIGEVISRRRAAAMGDAGVSKVSGVVEPPPPTTPETVVA